MSDEARHIRHTHKTHDSKALCGADLGPANPPSCWAFEGLDHVFNHYAFNSGYITVCPECVKEAQRVLSETES